LHCLLRAPDGFPETVLLIRSTFLDMLLAMFPRKRFEWTVTTGRAMAKSAPRGFISAITAFTRSMRWRSGHTTKPYPKCPSVFIWVVTYHTSEDSPCLVCRSMHDPSRNHACSAAKSSPSRVSCASSGTRFVSDTAAPKSTPEIIWFWRRDVHPRGRTFPLNAAAPSTWLHVVGLLSPCPLPTASRNLPRRKNTVLFQLVIVDYIPKRVLPKAVEHNASPAG